MNGSLLVSGRISWAIRSQAVSFRGRGMLGICWMMPQISASAVQMLPPMPIREFWLPLLWSKLICRLAIASGATRSAVSRFSFSESIDGHHRRQAPHVVHERVAVVADEALDACRPRPATAATACLELVALRPRAVRETPARSCMKARTSLSFSASVVGELGQAG